MYYVIARIRDHTAEYWSAVCWTQDVRFAIMRSDPPMSHNMGKECVLIPVVPELNQDGVCLVAQDNPRVKECKRHGSTTSN